MTGNILFDLRKAKLSERMENVLLKCCALRCLLIDARMQTDEHLAYISPSVLRTSAYNLVKAQFSCSTVLFFKGYIFLSIG